MKHDESEKCSTNSIGLLRCTALTLAVFCGYEKRQGHRGLRYGDNMVTPLEWWKWRMQMHYTQLLTLCRASNLEEARRVSSLSHGSSPTRMRASSMPSRAHTHRFRPSTNR